ncbi:polar amino acid transport system substrate-binding protein [Arcanobacterium wilhelmae]|uniref:Polar amino acid transport system substrate-binding protein n=1 Tax=Arcanobacterium wilhelmae TaxID=1803177 RepID=A0ABT9NA27_9ACTO|nr:transporter substrate-binding domain-containing protein [Arcanobacterium wilhelmae]MDP9800076.1 polar amino acid transport system substrate-binding protein [Arcanobacterium wilhelmae]WFN89570.1 transporter substrate-binding domain-containing protein [Arcanobacterium wilhelmae]
MKFAKLAVLAAAALLALGACSQSATTNSSPEPGMEFAVGFDQSYPPYGFIGPDGNYTGFDLDLAAEVAKRNGWTYKAEPINWDTKDAELETGAITAIWNGFTMEGREGQYTFSDPYMLNGQVVVVKAGSGIKDVAGLKGRNVVTQVDSAALDVLTGAQKKIADTFGSLQERDNYNTAFMELESGAVDAVACDLSIAQFQMAANPGAYFQLPDPLSSEHYVVAFKKGRTELAAAVTKTLREMAADGTVEKIAKKYEKDGLSDKNWLLK